MWQAVGWQEVSQHAVGPQAVGPQEVGPQAVDTQLKSLTSEATPSATQFFRRAYKISHFSGL